MEETNRQLDIGEDELLDSILIREDGELLENIEDAFAELDDSDALYDFSKAFLHPSPQDVPSAPIPIFPLKGTTIESSEPDKSIASIPPLMSLRIEPPERVKKHRRRSRTPEKEHRRKRSRDRSRDYLPREVRRSRSKRRR